MGLPPDCRSFSLSSPTRLLVPFLGKKWQSGVRPQAEPAQIPFSIALSSNHGKSFISGNLVGDIEIFLFYNRAFLISITDRATPDG
jgi:hypothetical protein